VPDIDLLSIARGTVTSPAGCGKTHLIAEALTRQSGIKPILVLTHTNAGVAALRGRLDRMGVPAKAYRLFTIDGWGIRLIRTFPARSGHNPEILDLNRPGTDYPSIRDAAWKLLQAGHVTDVLRATYDRLIVDECQDCSVRQLRIVYYAADGMPTCVLGDPMQAIFDFGDQLADWNEHVCKHFPFIGELTTPWRWKNAGTEGFGLWLLEVRRKLISGRPIDLRTAPPEVTWVHLDSVDDHKRRLVAARTQAPNRDGSVLIIGDSKSPPSQREIAGQTPGAVTVESVDLKDLVEFARDLNLAAPDALDRVVHFAGSVMINVGAPDLLQRVNSLQRGTARKEPTDVERAALSFKASPSAQSAADLLVAIGKEGGVRPHRPAVLRASLKALQSCDGAEGNTFRDAAIRAREQNRLIGRPLPKRAVGSTLLLKGLEADVSVILNAADLNARNLYVAMTRGSRALVICSPSPLLNPA
jgi:AAA domain